MVNNVNKTNQLNCAIDKELESYYSKSLANNPVKYPLPILTISLMVGEKFKHTLNSGITCF